MKKLISPKQVARAIGVSESTLKRWCDRGLIPMTKTAGGHRRLEVEAVVRFLRDSGHQIVEPELLGLPAVAGRTGWTLNRAREMLVSALVRGDEPVARQIIFDLLLAGHSATAIFDDAMAPSLHDIGEKWSCGDVAVYQERLSCEICMRILRELRTTTFTAELPAPSALGATLEHDIYTIPVTMAEVVLRSVGWHASSLGSNLPAVTLQDAIRSSRPRLFWLSVSWIEDDDVFADSVNSIFDAADSVGCALAVGGQALDEPLRRRIQYTSFCETFRDLELLARSLNPVSGQPTPPPRAGR